MLEDKSIQHLISWSATNDSFVMSPSGDFSKVLSQYFKHTNISSFVRQLNMYGFHKVSDVFHTGSPDSAHWEFKHGNGNFKRGDLQGLREIKRRASRHTLTQRESAPPTSRMSFGINGLTSYDPAMEGIDRVSALEHHIYDMSTRLHRTEEAFVGLNTRYQVMYDGLLKCQQWSNDLVNCLDSLLPDHESTVRPNLNAMRVDIGRQAEFLRSFDQPPDPYTFRRPTFFATGMSVDSGQLSPRQASLDDSRRGSLGLRASNFSQPILPVAPLAPPMIPSSRRYGSIGRPEAPMTSTRSHHPSTSIPSSGGVQTVVPVPTSTHPPRRHTTADLRADPNWQTPPASEPIPPHPPSASGQWPTSPLRIQTNADDNQQIQSMLARYEIRPQSYGAEQTTPPDIAAAATGWDARSAFLQSIQSGQTTGPPTRRTSVASNVHSLLNHPSEVPEIEQDEASLSEDRKRKRMQ